MRSLVIVATIYLAAACGSLSPGVVALATDPKDPPETVIATYRPKRGKEVELQRVIEDHWRIVQKLGLVMPEPHLLFRGEDAGGKVLLINIIAWRNHAVPDHAPPEVQAIWARMGPLVEPRDGHEPIEFPEVTPAGTVFTSTTCGR